MKKTAYFLIALLFISFYSCQGKSDSLSLVDSIEKKSSSFGDNSEANISTPVDRKIIKDGYISFETTDLEKTKEFITQKVSTLKGYISNDKINDYSDKLEYNITIRIPAKNFELLLENVSKHATKLERKSIHARDVTEEFIDIESRINTKKELENRYKEILKQANKVQEILSIEKEIGKLREEIESMEGRLNYLKDKVAFSKLDVVFFKTKPQTSNNETQFGKAIQNGWSNLLWFFEALLTIWPFLIILSVIFYFVRRLYTKKLKNN
jgi:hypothetical protein